MEVTKSGLLNSHYADLSFSQIPELSTGHGLFYLITELVSAVCACSQSFNLSPAEVIINPLSLD